MICIRSYSEYEGIPITTAPQSEKMRGKKIIVEQITAGTALRTNGSADTFRRVCSYFERNSYVEQRTEVQSAEFTRGGPYLTKEVTEQEDVVRCIKEHKTLFTPAGADISRVIT
jgi:hypothetical protein